jgi:hypothetical protein
MRKKSIEVQGHEYEKYDLLKMVWLPMKPHLTSIKKIPACVQHSCWRECKQWNKRRRKMKMKNHTMFQRIGYLRRKDLTSNGFVA